MIRGVVDKSLPDGMMRAFKIEPGELIDYPGSSPRRYRVLGSSRFGETKLKIRVETVDGRKPQRHELLVPRHCAITVVVDPSKPPTRRPDYSPELDV